MYKILPILLFASLLAVNKEHVIRTGQGTLTTSLISQTLLVQGELVLDSDIAVHGIQFDIKYNPLEIKSVTPLQISEYKVLLTDMSDSLLRGLIYSELGKALPTNIKYNFVNADGFNGVSTIQFTDFIAADRHGNSIDIQVKSYDIDFSGLTESERKKINNVQDVLDLIKEYKPDCILNSAGIVGKPNVDWCETNQLETIKGNTILPIIIAEACQKKNIYLLFP